ncbi:hypothetical protein [Zhihengliuella halotolerans]|uniref:hypothetical protein n=1 Tax=Zhihengliuella halotolerans TaxID=370736 RepID=UPI0011AEE376|nr:hypothetical protein [Zhihengliuella halotolerans]
MSTPTPAVTEYLKTRTILALVSAFVMPLVGMIAGAMLAYEFRADGPHDGRTVRNRKYAQVAAAVGAVLTVPLLLLFAGQVIGMLASLLP